MSPARHRRGPGARSIAAFAAIALIAVACGDGGADDGDTGAAEDDEAEPATDVEEGDSGFPSQPIELIVPYGAGGGGDQIARAVAGTAGNYTDVPIRLREMSAAGGAEAARYVKDADPDGHTLLHVQTGSFLVRGLIEDVGFTYEDFDTLAFYSQHSLMLTTSPDAPYDNLTELVEYARENDVTFGSAGPGSSGHQLGELLNDHFDLDMTHVPYESGPEANLAVIGGHVDWGAASLGSVADQVTEGMAKPLAVSSGERLDDFPDVPSFGDEGLDFEFVLWRGVAAPAGLPDDVAEYLEELFANIYADEAYQTNVTRIESEVQPPAENQVLGREATMSYMQDEVERLSGVIELLRID